jgi:2-haloacid dehalogenase
LLWAVFRLCTLTNKTAEIARQQLEQAGSLQAFERGTSVDDVRLHRPAPEVYATVARASQTKSSKLCLVACHTWNTPGAVAEHWDAALILRSGNAFLDLGSPPQVTGADHNEVADKLIARSAPTERSWLETLQTHEVR